MCGVVCCLWADWLLRKHQPRHGRVEVASDSLPSSLRVAPGTASRGPALGKGAGGLGLLALLLRNPHPAYFALPWAFETSMKARAPLPFWHHEFSTLFQCRACYVLVCVLSCKPSAPLHSRRSYLTSPPATFNPDVMTVIRRACQIQVKRMGAVMKVLGTPWMRTMTTMMAVGALVRFAVYTVKQ